MNLSKVRLKNHTQENYSDFYLTLIENQEMELS